MALSTRQLAAFVQKVAKLQPQDPPVYSDLRGCSTCIPTLNGFGMGLDSIPTWLLVTGALVVGAGAMHVATKKRVLGLGMRKAKKSKKARKARRNRRRR